MAKLILELDTDNDAFQGDKFDDELVRIFEHIIGRIKIGDLKPGCGFHIQDDDDNNVGDIDHYT